MYLAACQCECEDRCRREDCVSVTVSLVLRSNTKEQFNIGLNNA